VKGEGQNNKRAEKEPKLLPDNLSDYSAFNDRKFCFNTPKKVDRKIRKGPAFTEQKEISY